MASGTIQKIIPVSTSTNNDLAIKEFKVATENGNNKTVTFECYRNSDNTGFALLIGSNKRIRFTEYDGTNWSTLFDSYLP